MRLDIEHMYTGSWCVFTQSNASRGFIRFQRQRWEVIKRKFIPQTNTLCINCSHAFDFLTTFLDCNQQQISVYEHCKSKQLRLDVFSIIVYNMNRLEADDGVCSGWMLHVNLLSKHVRCNWCESVFEICHHAVVSGFFTSVLPIKHGTICYLSKLWLQYIYWYTSI